MTDEKKNNRFILWDIVPPSFKVVAITAYELRCAFASCFIAWYILHVASANVQHYVTETNRTRQGEEMTRQNLQLDQNAQVVNAINACANVVRSGKGL